MAAKMVAEILYPRVNFLPATLITALLASLVVAYIMNPVFAADFMTAHNHDQGFDIGQLRGRFAHDTSLGCMKIQS